MALPLNRLADIDLALETIEEELDNKEGRLIDLAMNYKSNVEKIRDIKFEIEELREIQKEIERIRSRMYKGIRK